MRALGVAILVTARMMRVTDGDVANGLVAEMGGSCCLHERGKLILQHVTFLGISMATNR
jgi:hypothetical protein